jgi:hypothetical protein
MNSIEQQEVGLNIFEYVISSEVIQYLEDIRDILSLSKVSTIFREVFIQILLEIKLRKRRGKLIRNGVTYIRRKRNLKEIPTMLQCPVIFTHDNLLENCRKIFNIPNKKLTISSHFYRLPVSYQLQLDRFYENRHTASRSDYSLKIVVKSGIFHIVRLWISKSIRPLLIKKKQLDKNFIGDYIYIVFFNSSKSTRNDVDELLGILDHTDIQNVDKEININQKVYCAVCNKTLTTFEYFVLGIGPECAKNYDIDCSLLAAKNKIGDDEKFYRLKKEFEARYPSKKRNENPVEKEERKERRKKLQYYDNSALWSKPVVFSDTEDEDDGSQYSNGEDFIDDYDGIDEDDDDFIANDDSEEEEEKPRKNKKKSIQSKNKKTKKTEGKRRLKKKSKAQESSSEDDEDIVL